MRSRGGPLPEAFVVKPRDEIPMLGMEFAVVTTNEKREAIIAFLATVRVDARNSVSSHKQDRCHEY